MGDYLEPIDFGSLSVHSLSAGYYHTCALADQPGETGAVVCWGANDKGQVTACHRQSSVSQWRIGCSGLEIDVDHC